MLDGSHVTTMPPPPHENETRVEEVGDDNEAEHEDRDHHKHVHHNNIDYSHEVVSDFATFTRCDGDFCDRSCDFVIHIHPSIDMEEQFHTNTPLYLTISVVVLFAFTSAVFILYDYLVQRRNTVVLDNANHQNMIIQKLFPKQIHDRLLGKDEESPRRSRRNSAIPEGAKFKLNSFLSSSFKLDETEEMGASSMGDSSLFMRPQESLADFFPACTVMFGKFRKGHFILRHFAFQALCPLNLNVLWQEILRASVPGVRLESQRRFLRS